MQCYASVTAVSKFSIIRLLREPFCPVKVFPIEWWIITGTYCYKLSFSCINLTHQMQLICMLMPFFLMHMDDARGEKKGRHNFTWVICRLLPFPPSMLLLTPPPPSVHPKHGTIWRTATIRCAHTPPPSPSLPHALTFSSCLSSK